MLQQELVKRLVDVYVKSRQNLLSEIALRLHQNRSISYQENMIRAIDMEIAKLTKASNAWSEIAVKEAYMDGASDAWKAVGSRNPFRFFGGVHTSAVSILVNNTKSLLEAANNLVGRQLQDTVRKIGINAVTRQFAESLTWGQTKKLIMNDLVNSNFMSVPYRNGNGSMRIDSYAELVARTTTAEATNTGTINQMQAMGQYTVKLTEHQTTCKVCAIRQGRVYRTVNAGAFAEGDPRRNLPHISMGMPRWPEYKTIHPNCLHRIVPYIWDQKSKAEQNQMLAKSNASFVDDPRSKVEIARYERSQKVNADRLRDRKQWEQYKLVLPNSAPKTFSGFRSMKRSNSANYKSLLSEYRAAIR